MLTVSNIGGFADRWEDTDHIHAGCDWMLSTCGQEGILDGPRKLLRFAQSISNIRM